MAAGGRLTQEVFLLLFLFVIGQSKKNVKCTERIGGEAIEEDAAWRTLRGERPTSSAACFYRW